MKIKILEHNFKKKITYLSKFLGIASITLLFILIYSNNKIEENFSEYSGFFIRTDRDCFFVAYNDSQMFTKTEVVKIFSSNNSNMFNEFNSGDYIIIKITTVGDLNPRVTEVYQIRLLKKGDLSNIEESVVKYLESLGYKLE